MKLLVVGARLTTCALSNKIEATVIKTKLVGVLQKWSKSSPIILHGKNEATIIKRDSDGHSKSGPKVVQKYSIEWSSGVLHRFFSPVGN